jgi:predicted site-specific integrase-resolvase
MRGGKKRKMRNKIMRNTYIENLINEVEASKMLGIASETLRIGYRYKGLIPFVRMKKNCVRYRPSDVREFIASRLVKVTK